MDEAQTSGLARYTIHLPSHDAKGNSLGHILPSVRRLLTQAGFNGRHIHREVEAEWGDDAPVAHVTVTIDAGDLPEVEEAIKNVASSAKEMGDLEGVYVTKMPISNSWVV